MMKRKLALLILALLAVLLPACSVSNDFVVVNESNQSIEVQYQLKLRYNETTPPATPTPPPAKQDADEFLKSGQVWREVSAEQYQYDQGVGIVTVTVAPGEALRVGNVLNYSRTSLDLVTLSITGALGLVKLEGRQVPMQFGEESGRFVIRYR